MSSAESNPISLEEGVKETEEIERKEGETLNDHVLNKIEAVDIGSEGSMPMIGPEEMMAQ